MTTFIEPSHMPEESTLEVVRSKANRRVLARVGDDGIYLWERLSNMQYVFPWEDIMRLYEQRKTSCTPRENAV